MVEKLEVYIGTEPDFWLPTEVLRYSILSRTNTPISFKEIKEVPAKKYISPYSGLKRFFVPKLNKYQSRALYINSGALVLFDIQELFNIEMNNYGAIARPKLTGVRGYYTGVMLLDCPRLKWNGDEIIEKAINHDIYNKTVWGMEGGLVTKDLGPLPDEYNHFDQFSEHTKILVYSDFANAPWRNESHPQYERFKNELKKAIEDKEIPIDLVKKEIERQKVNPRLID